MTSSRHLAALLALLLPALAWGANPEEKCQEFDAAAGKTCVCAESLDSATVTAVGAADPGWWDPDNSTVKECASAGSRWSNRNNYAQVLAGSEANIAGLPAGNSVTYVTKHPGGGADHLHGFNHIPPAGPGKFCHRYYAIRGARGAPRRRWVRGDVAQLDLEAAAWGYEPVIRFARHEAGHAVAAHVLGNGDRILEVTIEDAETAEETGVFGIVKTEPDFNAHQAAASVQAAQRSPHPAGETLRDPGPDEGWLLAMLGVEEYAGVAAEYPRATGIAEGAWTSVQGDQVNFAYKLARAGLRWPFALWCWPAYRAAQRLVDAFWGETLWVAAALCEAKRLSGDEVRELFKAAPKMRNHRPAWPT